MKNFSKLLLIFTPLLSVIQSLVIKRQIIFPDNDDISNRYASIGHRIPPSPNNLGPNNFQFNPFLRQVRPQQQQNFYPQQQQNFYPQQQQQQFNPQQQQNQQFQRQPNNNIQQQPQQMSPPVSPQVQACIDSCVESTPGQYNPLCGTNNVTFHNQERFNCAVQCGQSVQIQHRGMCPRPTLPPWQRQQ